MISQWLINRGKSLPWIQIQGSFWIKYEIQHEKLDILLKCYSFPSRKCSKSHFNTLQATYHTGDWLKPDLRLPLQCPGQVLFSVTSVKTPKQFLWSSLDLYSSNTIHPRSEWERNNSKYYDFFFLQSFTL